MIVVCMSETPNANCYMLKVLRLGKIGMAERARQNVGAYLFHHSDHQLLAGLIGRRSLHYTCQRLVDRVDSRSGSRCSLRKRGALRKSSLSPRKHGVLPPAQIPWTPEQRKNCITSVHEFSS